MPIKVACDCGQKFSARDSMAGKRVKCPKCNEPLVIPKPRSKNSGSSSASRPGTGITDLLDEVGVQGARTGPICPECGTDMQPTAVICIECGFNMALGRKMYTEDKTGMDSTGGMTNAEKLLAKAEREIEQTAISSDEQNFGDGEDAWLIALGAGIVALTMVLISLALIFYMDKLPQTYTARISFLVACFASVVGFWWIVIRGFLEHIGHGLALLFSPILAGILGVVFLLLFALFGLPTVGLMIGMAAGMGYFYYYSSTRGMWIAEIMYIGGQLMANIMIAVIASADAAI